MNTAIIDYGMCNLDSVSRAFEECGANVKIATTPEELAGVDKIVLPGVGAFPEGMGNLKENKWDIAINEALKNPKVSFIGICLGMQLLASQSEEGGLTNGLNLISGKVVNLKLIAEGLRRPHVGWNEINYDKPNPLLEGIPSGTDFYFVHNFYYNTDDDSFVAATTSYGKNFASILHKDNIFAVQFHPEKSGKAGFQLIKNFLEY